MNHIAIIEKYEKISSKLELKMNKFSIIIIIIGHINEAYAFIGNKKEEKMV